MARANIFAILLVSFTESGARAPSLFLFRTITGSALITLFVSAISNLDLLIRHAWPTWHKVARVLFPNMPDASCEFMIKIKKKKNVNCVQRSILSNKLDIKLSFVQKDQ